MQDAEKKKCLKTSYDIIPFKVLGVDELMVDCAKVSVKQKNKQFLD